MNNKSLLIITLYRLPDRSEKGIYTVKAQLDYQKAKVKTAKAYRNEIFDTLNDYIEA